MAELLLVEDDNSLTDGLVFTLKKNQYQVDTARTVAEAEKLLREKAYDLLILDITLPDGTGYDICTKVRRKSSVPVIFLTALDEEVHVVKGLQLGGDDYMTKPFRLNELLARIQALLRRCRLEQEREKADGRVEGEKEKLISGEIEVWLSEYKVRKAGRTVEVTANEYRLLCLFLSHQERVLPREWIKNRLWDGNGEYVDDNTLSVYIRRLRSKVEENPDLPRRLMTVRGIGYIWKGERT